ncbi:Peptidoglycan/LPS O-acetylase OafA/YrhL, contains acyltransferase and SGNH-hydrolase domains [Marinobacter sp. es.048]|uniref:acyltransferase family protein n=1 Tax=Marinobacter sp. es.048 TaxID=1761795 RepID=UPI000B58D013|nr:acyltransferase [Marinobacter sp. es.048]SNC68246.1 Peptidoglycan/LPS O-acetylase OafA/YrhL, contains acyltransferase and SGNH-hydrolase domains [Marinobacter sp. es.048]
MDLPKLDSVLALRKLPGLDGFRMIAVMAVVLAHSGVGSFFSARHGVAGFFVLSGFLITWLLLKEYEKAGRISLRDFYMRRSLRIFPAYYAFLFASISWDLFRGNDDIKDVILPGLFYLMNYHNALEGHSSSSLAHLWSLAIEEQFYLLWPMVFMFLIKRGRNFAIGFLVIVSVMVMAWRTYSFSILDFGTSYAYNAFDTRFDNLAIGCAMAFLLEKKHFLKFADKVSSRPWMPIITLVFLTLSRQAVGSDYTYGPAFTVDALLLAVLLLQLMRLSQGRFWGWLNHPAAIYLGLISYPIYLWHVWGIQAGNKLNFLPESIQILAGVFISCALAAISYHFLEKPFLSLKQKYEKAGKSSNSTLAAARPEKLGTGVFEKHKKN